MEVKKTDVVLCTFYFSDLKTTKKIPILVLKDNLPYNDFIGIPISSRISNLCKDEHIIDNSDFKTGGIPRKSKIMLRKPFVSLNRLLLKNMDH